MTERTALYDTDTVDRVRALTEGRGLTACVVTFGCQQNESDSEKLRGMLSAMGYAMTEDAEHADVVLFNTCAIRERAEQKALSHIGALRHAWEENRNKIIAVCGCMTAQEHRTRQLRAHYPYVAFTLTPATVEQLPDALYTALTEGQRTFSVGEECPSVVEGVPVVRTLRHRAWVSIMYGCNNFCSYCVVPYVRGRERSRMSAPILEEIRSLVADGCHDITLLGQNVNSYRGDITFAELLDRAADIEGDFLLRFMTSHPKDVPQELIDVIARHRDKIAPHFHLPLQSGSDRILFEMNRRYDTARYLDIVARLRAAVPDIAITSDIIVGFPSETEEDFEGTLSMLRTVGFDMVYSFIYSPRRGTPAAAREQVADDVKHARMDRLLALQDEISLSRMLPYVGRRVRVLVDSRSKNGKFTALSGRTPDAKLVHFEGDDSLIGRFVYVHIDRADAFSLKGTLVD